jgi:hypothetical protein
VLAEFARLREVLATTHTAIPQLLARQRTISRALGLNETEELRRQLADVVAERESAVRRRSASIAAIVELEPALQTERAAVEQQQREHAVEAVRAFQARYEACVGQLQALWEEGRVLASALRSEVPMPLPVRVVTSPVDAVARAQPILADVAVTVDAEAGKLGSMIDQLDAALGLCNAIRQSADWEARAHRLAVDRGAASGHTGVYRVMLTFRSQVDGLEFEPGTLVDHSLIGSGMMHRLMTGRRYIAPVGLEAA